MYKRKYKDIPLFDAHVHISMPMEIEKKAVSFQIEKEKLNIDRFLFLSSPNENIGEVNYLFNYEILYLRKFFTGSYAYAGLVHRLDDSDTADDFLNQVKTYWEMGYDGIKMVEEKPNYLRVYKRLLGNEVYKKFLDYAEENEIPITLHIADPGVNWDINKISDYGKEQGWYYGENDVQFDDLYKDLFEVMENHKTLKLTLAHFGFFSEHMDWAERFFQYPDTRLDLTPGGEQLINISRTPNKTRMFFKKYQDRIIYGTDMYNFADPDVLLTDKRMDWISIRPDLVFEFLESDDEYEYYGDRFKGLAFDKDILKKIYFTNAYNLLKEPRKINISLFNEKINALIDSDLLREKEREQLIIIKNYIND